MDELYIENPSSLDRTNNVTQLIYFVPLFQTFLWICLIVCLISRFQGQLKAFLNALTKRLKAGSSIKVGSIEIGELKKEVKGVRKELSEINEKASGLFLTTMSPNMYFNLRKLNSGNFGHYVKSQGLKRELYHLRDIGYIEVESISALPYEGNNLSDHVKISLTGKQFVELRESVEKEREEKRKRIEQEERIRMYGDLKS